MIPRGRAPAPAAPRNRGFALIAFVLLLVLVAGYVVAAALNRTGSELASAREERTMNALRQAKAALIAYAASEQWQLGCGSPPCHFQPGALPCPDRNNDGASDGICPNSLTRIGRLPWRTIGSDDLKDASGEELWYVVSPAFVKNWGTTVINSDVQGQLSVTGIAPAANVVAIVFAPGNIVQNQTRDPTNAAAYNDPANYLEQFDVATYASFTTTALPSDALNDRLLIISQADLMAAVEPVVAAKIEREIKPYIQSQFSAWGSDYPFAAPFVSGGVGPGRAQSEYKGATSQTNGLLPITRDSSWLSWTSPSVTQVAGGTGTVTSASCSVTSGQVVCTVNYTSGDKPNIRLRATLVNGAKSFVIPPATTDVSITDKDGGASGWDNTPTATGTFLSGANLGNGRATYVGRLRDLPSTKKPVTLRLSLPGYHSLTSSADATSGWFIANEWYRQTYYAVSPGYLPGGGGSCTTWTTPPPPANPCLKATNKLPSPSNNKRAMLVFAGRALNGAVRPTNLAGDYFEGANLTAVSGSAPYAYEHRAGTPVAINDRVVVLAP